MSRPRSESAFFEEAQVTRREFEELKVSSPATLSTFVAIAGDLNPETWVEAPKLAEGSTFVETYIVPTYQRLLLKEGVIEWLEEEFESDLDEDEIEEMWTIGEFTRYPDANTFINDIDFSVLRAALNDAWTRSCKE